MDGKAAAAGGFRVFRIKLKAETRERLRKLYEELYAAIWGKPTDLPRTLLWYSEEYKEMDVAAVQNRFRAGYRAPPKKHPPIPLLVRFRFSGKEYGNRAARIIIDLDNCLLRIPCIDLNIPLQSSLCRALREELELEPRPVFTLFLRYNGKLRLVAHREPPRFGRLVREECDDYYDVDAPAPFRVTAIDHNSRNGLVVMAFDVREDGTAVMAFKRRWRPPKKHWKLIKALQKYKDKPTSENLRKVLEKAPKRLRKYIEKHGLTPSKAEELIRDLHYRHREKCMFWERRVIGRIRKLIRGAGGRAIILVDAPDPESLRGRQLQNTVLKVLRKVKVMAKYEGVLYWEKRESGKKCPLCGEAGEEIGERYFKCTECNITWNRDYCTCFRLAGPLAFFAFKRWLREHYGELAPNFPVSGSPPVTGTSAPAHAGVRRGSGARV